MREDMDKIRNFIGQSERIFKRGDMYPKSLLSLRACSSYNSSKKILTFLQHKTLKLTWAQK